ncbi:MAG: hypothetical protein DVB26_04160 [Verrucomicrobia bacterium]|nr:MAG: hypothetical protein DVB26_04160 [Verrucomicrobiota bacterium]
MIRALCLSLLVGISCGLATAMPSDIREIEEAHATQPTRPSQAGQDLLRFVNGDQLHGTFQGIKPGALVLWQRSDLTAPGEFKSAEIQKIILRAGRPAKSNESLAHVALVNGDRIPGTLVALDDDMLSVDTSFAGVMRLPRKLVGMVAPMPLGGRVLYHGPYSEDGWLMTNTEFPDGIPAPTADDDEDKAAKPAADDANAAAEDAGDGEAQGKAKDPPKTAIPRWDFSGAAWYWNQKHGATALTRKSGMTDRSLLRFNLAWRNRLMVYLAFHADGKRPPKPAKDGDAANAKAGAQAEARGMQAGFEPRDLSLPQLFGNSYVLQINTGFVMLLRCGFDDKGNPTMERIQVNNPGIRLQETGSATFELRCDRLKGTILLFIDGEFAMQWAEPGLTEAGGYAGKGSGFGFLTQMDNSPLRLSDVVIAEWNGMPDSARSMQVDAQDIVLLTNGSDRFSGHVSGFQNGKLLLHSKFGNFAFPLADIAEVRFAADSLTKPAEPTPEHIIVRLDPIGNITGTPVSGDASSLKLLTPYAGSININLDSAVILDFQPSNNFLDAWDPQF